MTETYAFGNDFGRSIENFIDYLCRKSFFLILQLRIQNIKKNQDKKKKPQIY